VSAIDIHYLEQPRGGELEVMADGKVIETFSTGGDAKRPAFRKSALPAGAKRLELRAKSRVRLFGASLEAASGAVVDNLGIVNATAKGLAKYNAPDHLRAQLAHRAPDLVIVMFGTNEAEWLVPKGQGMAEHEKVFGDLLASVRAANPDSSCLVVSPLDQLDWRKDGAPPRESIPAMVDAQHRAAKKHGCAFWDTYEWMGGKGASAVWFRRGLVIKDFQHPTSEGAARIAEALFAGLVR
jgi:lysophospholipase L1-like esterase